MYESLFFTYMHVPLPWITSVSIRAVCMAWYCDVTDRNFEIIWTYAATDYFIILWESILIDDFKMYFLFLLKLKIIIHLLSGTIRYRTVYIFIKYEFFSKCGIHVNSSIRIIKRNSSLIQGNMILLIITFATSCIFEASLALTQSI